MIIYWFNNKNRILYKLRPLSDSKFYERRNGCFYMYIDPESDPRKDKNKRWINVPCKEGKVQYCAFWLKEEDDNKAIEIYEKHKKEQIDQLEKTIKRLEKIKEGP